jgi:UDP-2-acetamido-3-amino-2,3-dideoxy-glucuronate N-acetyltransferase
LTAYFVHPTAVVDEPVVIGAGTKIWHFCHVSAGASLGAGCTLGQNVFVAPNVRLGSNVKVQNNVSLYEGVTLEDDVFCGPSCVFTNVSNPRSEIVRRQEYRETVVRRGATLGANSTVVCGTVIGRYAFVAAGAVVTRGVVPDYALMMGVPARQAGWISRHGHRLTTMDADWVRRCPESGWRYRETEDGRLACVDWDEERPLPAP